MIRRFLSISGLLLTASAITACGGVDSDESQPIVTEPDQGEFVALFNPSAAQVPFPNDIFFSGTTDGTLNIPVSAANPALSAVNELDGYSTTASIYVDTTDSIAPASLVYGQTVFLVNTNTMMPVPATVSRGDFSNGFDVIEIVPAGPLDPATTYAGFVTKNVVSTTGDNLVADAAFASFQQLYAAGVTPETVDTGDATTDALYGAIFPLFQGADAATIGAQNLAVAWSFKTQSIGASLNSVEGMATAQDSGFAPIPKNGVDYTNGVATTADLNEQLQGKADVYVGIIELPYFHDAENPLSGFWQA
ncbi:MAG: hypothetical protein R3270_10880, partial [Gammaproteobacteria bacterium]|nr:hypothetical protein [Gammaproteobacteria bacterium]